MSDEVDDVYPVDGNVDNNNVDRTYRIAIPGTLKATYEPTPRVKVETQPDVPKQGQVKTVNVHVVILRDKPQAQGGTPVCDEALVNSDWTRARERYAQVGVTLNWTIDRIEDPPSDVDLSDGLRVVPFDPRAEYWRLEQGIATLTDEAKAMIDAYGTQSQDDIHVFYANRCTYVNLQGTDTTIAGMAISDGGFDESLDPYTYNIFLGVQRPGNMYFLAGHEACHILTDWGHELEPTNMMYAGLVPVDWANNSVTCPKRLSQNQDNRIRTSRHAK